MLEFKVKDISELSSVGDAFINFIYSLALSNSLKKPVSRRASNSMLSEALIKSGVRDKLKSRVSKHALADYAEGIVFDAWLKEKITIEECVNVLSRNISSKDRTKLREESVEAFSELLEYIGRLK